MLTGVGLAGNVDLWEMLVKNPLGCEARVERVIAAYIIAFILRK